MQCNEMGYAWANEDSVTEWVTCSVTKWLTHGLTSIV